MLFLKAAIPLTAAFMLAMFGCGCAMVGQFLLLAGLYLVPVAEQRRVLVASAVTGLGKTGNQSYPEASIPDLAVRIIRLFEQLSLDFSESNLTLCFPF